MKPLEVQTPVGLARAHFLVAPAQAMTLVLGHGAGAGVDTRDLLALRNALPAFGVGLVLVEQPWLVAGRRIAAPPTQLDIGWLAVVKSGPVQRFISGQPLIVGGRSSGARVACRTVTEVGASGVLALAFPLQPPGRVTRSRVGELQAVNVPLLVIQGTRDAFGSPAGFPASVAVTSIESADHSFAVPKKLGTQDAAIAEIVRAAHGFLRQFG